MNSKIDSDQKARLKAINPDKSFIVKAPAGSGKTGLFARKKISKELDEITGRKEKKIIKKRKKRIEEVDPSSGSLSNDKKQPQNISQVNQGLGFFSYIFLIIIVGFYFMALKTY